MFSDNMAEAIVTNSVFAGCLLAVATLLQWRNEATWKIQRTAKISECERNYLRRRRSRRRQINLIIGMVGALIFVGMWVQGLLLMTIFWGGVVGMVFWIGLLACLDVIHTRSYFHEIQLSYLAKRAELAAELKRTRHDAGNGSNEGKRKDGRI